MAPWSVTQEQTFKKIGRIFGKSLQPVGTYSFIHLVIHIWWETRYAREKASVFSKREEEKNQNRRINYAHNILFALLVRAAMWLMAVLPVF